MSLKNCRINLKPAQRCQRASHTSLKCCGKAKTSLLAEGVLGDGITEQEELFIYGRLEELLGESDCDEEEDQPLTMSTQYPIRRRSLGVVKCITRVYRLGTVRYSTCPSLCLLNTCGMQCKELISIITFDPTMETDKLQTNTTTVCSSGSFPPKS